jgi:hypothetical protein
VCPKSLNSIYGTHNPLGVNHSNFLWYLLLAVNLGALHTTSIGQVTKDFNNMIGGKQEFVRSAFTLEANGQKTTPSKMPIWQYFL